MVRGVRVGAVVAEGGGNVPALEPPEELEPPPPDDPPDEPPLLPGSAAAACAVTVTLTLTVLVTVGAGSGVAVFVAVTVVVTVAVGRTLSAVGFTSVPLPWPPAPTPRKKAKPIAGSTYLFRARLGALGADGCGGREQDLLARARSPAVKPPTVVGPAVPVRTVCGALRVSRPSRGREACQDTSSTASHRAGAPGRWRVSATPAAPSRKVGVSWGSGGAVVG